MDAAHGHSTEPLTRAPEAPRPSTLDTLAREPAPVGVDGAARADGADGAVDSVGSVGSVGVDVKGAWPRASDALPAYLAQHASRHGFFELVAALDDHLGGPPTGFAARPDEERLRFRHSPSFAFQAGDVESFSEAGARPELVTTFLGLVGAGTPLPLHLAEEVLDDDDRLAGQLLDLFHHRGLALLHRTWRHDRFDPLMVGTGPWAARLRHLAGVPETSTLAEATWMRLMPLLLGPQSARSLRDALAHAVQDELPSARVTFEELQGGAIPIADEDRAKLGVSCRLGVDTMLGEEAPDPSGGVRLVVGGVAVADRARLRPGGDLARALHELTLVLAPDALTLEVHVDEADLVCRLGEARLGEDARLG